MRDIDMIDLADKVANYKAGNITSYLKNWRDYTSDQNILDIARNSDDESKVKMILNESNPGENLDVPDPYYGGDDGFEKVFQLIDAACDEIAKKLT